MEKNKNVSKSKKSKVKKQLNDSKSDEFVSYPNNLFFNYSQFLQLILN